MLHLFNSDREHVEGRLMLMRALLRPQLRQQLPGVLSKLLGGDTRGGAWCRID